MLCSKVQILIVSFSLILYLFDFILTVVVINTLKKEKFLTENKTKMLMLIIQDLHDRKSLGIGQLSTYILYL